MIALSVHAKENIAKSFFVLLLIERDNYDRIKINNQDNDNDNNNDNDNDNDNDVDGDHGSIAMHNNPHDHTTIFYLNGGDANDIFPNSVTSSSFTEARTHV
jgi:hypothetical protein